MNVVTTLFSMLVPSTNGTQGQTQSDAGTSFAATLLLVNGNLGGDDSADVDVPDTTVDAQAVLVGPQTDPPVSPSQVVQSTGEPADAMVPSLELIVLMTDPVDGDGVEVGEEEGKRVAEALYNALATLLADGRPSGDSARYEVADGGDSTPQVAQPSNLATGGGFLDLQSAAGGRQSAAQRGIAQLAVEAEAFPATIAFGANPTEPARTQSGQEPLDSEVPRRSRTRSEDASQAVTADQLPSPTMHDVGFLAAVTAALGDTMPAELNQQNGRTRPGAENAAPLATSSPGDVRQHLGPRKTADLVRNQEVPAGAIAKLPGDRSDFNQTTSEPPANVDRRVSPKAQPEIVTHSPSARLLGMSGDGEGVLTAAAAVGKDGMSLGKDEGLRGRPLVQRQGRQPSVQSSEVTLVDVAGSSGKVVIPAEIDTVHESGHRLVREATDAHKPAATTGDAGSGEPKESVVKAVSNSEAKMGAPIDGFPSTTVQSQFVKANPVRAGLRTTDASPEAPIRHTDWVTLRVDTAGQGTVRIRVAVLGNNVRATILHEDAGIAAQLSTRVGDLRQALVRQGFSKSQLSIQPAPSSQQVAAAGSTWQPARFNPGTAGSPELLDPDQRSPSERGGDQYNDSGDRRDASQQRRQNQRER